MTEQPESNSHPEAEPTWPGYPPQGPLPPPPWASAQQPPPAPGRGPRRRYLRALGVAVLFAGTAAAGLGIGHSLSSSGGSGRASASGPSYSPGGSGYTNPYSGGGNNPYYGGNNPYFGGTGSGSSAGSGSSGASNGANNGGPSDASSVAAKVDPALVDINVTMNGEPAAGTGVVLSPSGEILTNNHVIDGATSISVTDLGNGKTYDASVVGYDSTDDVAVLQLKGASGLQIAKTDSSKATVGEQVVAVGNAGGKGGTPTATGGSINGLNQAVTASDPGTGTDENLTGMIETNATIQPGDSGGALVNTSGQVVGMDTAASQGNSLSSATSQGFAVPISKATSIASQIESGTGSSTVHVGPTAYLGVYVSTGGSPGNEGSQGNSGLQGNSGSQGGAVLKGVVSGGPAAQAGLAGGDVITSVGGQQVTSASTLTRALANEKPGASVPIGWTDASGASHTATITLGSGPAQ